MLAILLVDDDDAFRRRVVRGLPPIAHVVEADSVSSGERALLEIRDPPLELFLDYLLPGGTVLQLLAHRSTSDGVSCTSHAWYCDSGPPVVGLVAYARTSRRPCAGPRSYRPLPTCS